MEDSHSSQSTPPTPTPQSTPHTRQLTPPTQSPHYSPPTQPPQPTPHTQHQPSQPYQKLTISDLSIILNELNSVASKCFALGLQLGVEYPQLEKIEHDYSKCEDRLCVIIAKRLKQESLLTWHDIVRALRSDILKENRLANEIENRYVCPTTLENAQSVLTAVHSVTSDCVSSG